MREQSALARKPRMYFFCKCVGVLYQGYRVLGIIGNFAPRRQDIKCAAAKSKNVVPDAAPHILLKNFNSYSFSDWGRSLGQSADHGQVKSALLWICEI